MKITEPIEELRALLDTAKVGFLTTIGTDGYPHGRWMTPTMLSGEPRFLYCVSMASSHKAAEIQANQKVSWSFQTPALGKVIAARGSAVVLDNPQLKAQVLEAIGPNLVNFWRLNPEAKNLIVIETAIEQVSLYHPAKGKVTQSEVQS